MKTHLPVTNVETLLPEGEFIYSQTDLEGIIVEANDAFAKISNYSRDEMIGQPHSLVRHPDMPPEAFADLWRDLETGRPWRGIVKNRRKDGGFYWVVANASPVRENGKIIGYQSVRGRPTREEIAAAEAAYKRIKSGDRSLLVEHGRVVKRRATWINALLSLRSQMMLAGLFALLPALEALSGHLGGPILPGGVSLGVSALTVLYTLYYLLIYVPLTVRDLNDTSNWLERLLNTGDLRPRLNLERRDVIGAIARKADKFTSSIQATVQGISDVTHQVAFATGQVRSGVQTSRQAAHIQHDACASAAAGIEQVIVSIGEVVTHARATMDTARQTGDISREGARVTQDACRAVASLAETVHTSAEQVESLGQRSTEISRITGVIKEIAEQTNLLALNAAIEAARAGETGRGFAVVADEVRKLAERTTKATHEISAMVQGIQGETRIAVDGMRAGAQQVAEGVTLVNATEEALRHINEEMVKTTSMVSDITHASAEQQTAMTQLGKDVGRVADLTEQNVGVVTETGTMTDTLNAVVERMHKSVNQYDI